MENIAGNIKSDLHQQNQKLQKVNNNLAEMNTEISFSSKIMDDIKKNRKRNKIIIYGTMGAIGVALVLITYFKVIA